jgi:hypothetical protein
MVFNLKAALHHDKRLGAISIPTQTVVNSAGAVAWRLGGLIVGNSVTVGGDSEGVETMSAC